MRVRVPIPFARLMALVVLMTFGCVSCTSTEVDTAEHASPDQTADGCNLWDMNYNIGIRGRLADLFGSIGALVNREEYYHSDAEIDGIPHCDERTYDNGVKTSAETALFEKQQLVDRGACFHARDCVNWVTSQSFTFNIYSLGANRNYASDPALNFRKNEKGQYCVAAGPALSTFVYGRTKETNETVYQYTYNCFDPVSLSDVEDAVAVALIPAMVVGGVVYAAVTGFITVAGVVAVLTIVSTAATVIWITDAAGNFIVRVLSEATKEVNSVQLESTDALAVINRELSGYLGWAAKDAKARTDVRRRLHEIRAQLSEWVGQLYDGENPTTHNYQMREVVKSSMQLVDALLMQDPDSQPGL